MTTQAIPATMPGFLCTLERLLRTLLRLEHGANVLPLGHIVCYLSLLAFTLTGVIPLAPLAVIPTVILLTLLNYSLTIGVLHMHTHRPLFVRALPNRLVDILCCLPSWLSAAEMRTVHVVNHHRYNDGPGDVTSTAGYERGGRALWYWLRYGTIVRNFTMRHLFAADPTASRMSRRRSFLLDITLVLSIVIILTIAVPQRMLVFYWLPCVVTQISAGYFAWLTHAPARGRGEASSAINSVSNILNFFIFNQGYHTVHHAYPGIHWTQIPDRLHSMLGVDSDTIVPYWVTLNTAWRIVAPQRFRDARFGAAWQARLRRRLEEGSVRARALPWFAWI